MIAALFKFIDDGVALGKISNDYEIHALGDLTSFLSDAPGKLFREVMRDWPRFSKSMDC